MDRRSIKKSTPHLLMDFCNIKKWDHNTILKLQKDHDISYSFPTENERSAKVCMSKKDDLLVLGPPWYVLLEDGDIDRYLADGCLRKEDMDGWKLARKENLILSSEAKSKSLWKYLRKSQKEYRCFLNAASKDWSVDIDFLNNLNRQFTEDL
jgi:hypothetical protein